jgi:acyl-lipid omega-6 desaturase (Delta-12 desaturase)
MNSTPHLTKAQVLQSDWFRTLGKYEKTNSRTALLQLLNTLGPYFGLWGALIFLAQRGVAFGALLPLLLLAGGLLVRLFTIFHDCAHNAYFSSRRANRAVGYLAGLLTFTPYEAWPHSHSMHHATVGDLDRRGSGDIWTLTVAEYRAAPRRTKFLYWLYRNPLLLLLIGAPFLFLVLYRFSPKGSGKRERRSVWAINLALLLVMAIANVTIGLRLYLTIQLPIIAVAASIGAWLFYLQHQFEGVYWARHPEWDPMRAALEGSSYFQLPPVLQWFTGNIGLHHIHHLRPRIPSYNLQRCHNEVAAFRNVRPLTLRRSLKSLHMNLWDEANQKLVSFRALKNEARGAPDCR